MNSLLLAVPWVVVGIPVATAMRGVELRRKAKSDYSNFVEWREFPLVKTVAAKLFLFFVIGLASVLDPAPAGKTFVALGVVGTLGHLVETTVTFERPQPTRGYKTATIPCQECRLSSHDDCSNLRMLDGFEKGFKDEKGYRWPVCCCGFRLGTWEEVEV